MPFQYNFIKELIFPDKSFFNMCKYLYEGNKNFKNPTLNNTKIITRQSESIEGIVPTAIDWHECHALQVKRFGHVHGPGQNT